MVDVDRGGRPGFAEVSSFSQTRADIREADPELAEFLDFEAVWEGHETLRDFEGHGFSSKTMAVRRRFGVGRARYEQKLGRFMERPEALAYAPALVKRLLERRLSGRAARLRRLSPP